MAQQIIVKGKVEKAKWAGPGYYVLRDEATIYLLADWARDYVGQTLVISLEEPEKEPECSGLRKYEDALADV